MRGGTRGWVALWLVGAAGCAAVRAPAPPPITNGVQVGVASWYGPGFHGNRTANGEIYDQFELTAAHPSLPLGTRAMVTNLANGRAVEVRINDRGPFVDGRAIDLSYAAARTIGLVGAVAGWRCAEGPASACRAVAPSCAGSRSARRGSRGRPPPRRTRLRPREVAAAPRCAPWSPGRSPLGASPPRREKRAGASPDS